MLTFTAHALKCSAGNFGARRAFDLALRLDMLGKNDKLNGAGEEFILLACEMKRLKVALEEFTGEMTNEDPDSRR